MTVKTIHYWNKQTSANTVYCELRPEDMQWVMNKIIQILVYMGEIGISRNKELKELRNWWINPNPDLPFNTYVRNKNSPYSFVSGIVNNIKFGNQRDLSEQQLTILQHIINIFSNVVDMVEEGALKVKKKAVKIQKSGDNDQVLFTKQFFKE